MKTKTFFDSLIKSVKLWFTGIIISGILFGSGGVVYSTIFQFDSPGLVVVFFGIVLVCVYGLLKLYPEDKGKAKIDQVGYLKNGDLVDYTKDYKWSEFTIKAKLTFILQWGLIAGITAPILIAGVMLVMSSLGFF